MKKITVITPVYNVENYIGDCLDSILQQSYEHWECICLNDGSADGSLEILHQYAAKDSRFRVYSRENKGMASAYNALLDYVEDTDYLYIIDSDDYIHPSTFAICKKLLEEHDVDIVDFPLKRVSGDSRLCDLDCTLPDFEPKRVDDMSIYQSRKEVSGFWINKCNKLYRWDKIKDVRFDTQLSYEDDFWYASVIHTMISSKLSLPVPLYFYRRNLASVTGNLNFIKYTQSAIRRIDLSIAFFIEGGRLSSKYAEAFMRDLEYDAYRMILQKNMKKNKNKAQHYLLFMLASDALNRLVKEKGITFKRLPMLHRWALAACRAKRYHLCWFLVKLSAV